MCSLVATHTHPVRAASAALQLQPTAARAHVVGMVWYGMVWYGMVWYGSSFLLVLGDTRRDRGGPYVVVGTS
jgi:hypothetical protein